MNVKIIIAHMTRDLHRHSQYIYESEKATNVIIKYNHKRQNRQTILSYFT